MKKKKTITYFLLQDYSLVLMCLFGAAASLMLSFNSDTGSPNELMFVLFLLVSCVLSYDIFETTRKIMSHDNDEVKISDIFHKILNPSDEIFHNMMRKFIGSKGVSTETISLDLVSHLSGEERISTFMTYLKHTNVDASVLERFLSAKHPPDHLVYENGKVKLYYLTCGHGDTMGWSGIEDAITINWCMKKLNMNRGESRDCFVTEVDFNVSADLSEPDTNKEITSPDTQMTNFNKKIVDMHAALFANYGEQSSGLSDYDIINCFVMHLFSSGNICEDCIIVKNDSEKDSKIKESIRTILVKNGKTISFKKEWHLVSESLLSLMLQYKQDDKLSIRLAKLSSTNHEFYASERNMPVFSVSNAASSDDFSELENWAFNIVSELNSIYIVKIIKDL